jgi:hypothetical protein
MRSRALIASAYLTVLPVLGESIVGSFHNTYPPTPVEGNWVTKLSSDGQKVNLNGALALSGQFDSVTGVAHLTGFPCFSSQSPLATTRKAGQPIATGEAVNQFRRKRHNGRSGNSV